ncbi:hypothetical protein JQ595_37370 [Bradyrhizobium japonicum]|uniref:hypothetical protein n=1 Tax=Bradyrhizobium japonicum TaxID=375 RepID=UPI001BABFEB7|nr:hypothetical protein [Bradyrhizobium japonicum]MBR0734433.1 hypothetical protein [Bradyrhizobium japonicum]
MTTITIERLERALVLAAYLVARDGAVAIPLFDRLKRELAALRRGCGPHVRRMDGDAG